MQTNTFYRLDADTDMIFHSMQNIYNDYYNRWFGSQSIHNYSFLTEEEPWNENHEKPRFCN